MEIRDYKPRCRRLVCPASCCEVGAACCLFALSCLICYFAICARDPPLTTPPSSSEVLFDVSHSFPERLIFWLMNWSVTLTLRWTRTPKRPGRPEEPKGAKAWSWNRRRMFIWRNFTINVKIDFYVIIWSNMEIPDTHTDSAGP